MQTAVSKGNAFTLSMVAFLSVYREGFETVLFYKALYTYAGDSTGGIVPGFLAGSVCLTIVYYLITKAGLRIPIKWFFAVTSVFLYYMAFTFMGKGLQQLQIGNVISSTSVSFMPQIAWLGIYPTWETLAGQGVLVGAYLFAIIYTFGIKPEIQNKTLKSETGHIKQDIAVIHELLAHISQHAKRCETFLKDTNDQDLKELSRHLAEIELKIQELTDHARGVENRLLDEYDKLARPLKQEK
jgi:high-affinity iron transporter